MTDHSGAVRLAIATPCFGGQLTQLYVGSLLNLQTWCAQRGVTLDVLFNGGDAMITRSRAALVTQFMQGAATHLLFIDADIGFQPADVFRLLAAPGPVSGAMYPAKFLDWSRAEAFVKDGKKAQQGAARLIGGLGDQPVPSTANGFLAANMLGGGFMMIRREAIIAMEQHYPELRFSGVHTNADGLAGSPHRYAFFDPLIDENGGYLPEDYAFCRRWRQTGGEIWVDCQARLAHQGTYIFTAPPPSC